MNPKVLSALFMLMAVFCLAGVERAGAADIRFSVGDGGHRGYGYHEYRTIDPAYSTWYPDNSASYGYTDNSVYVEPYVYATPSVEFNSWYGDGYRSHGGDYRGRGGYGGGVRSGGYSGGYNSGGGHGGGGRR